MITLLYSTYISGACLHTDEKLSCVKYLSNYDGDTIRFIIPNVHSLLGRSISVRVGGIDTAEIKGKSRCEKRMAKLSRDFVGKLLRRAKRVDLDNIQRGKYFRIVADVKLDGESLSESLIKYNLATSYDGGTKSKVDWCEKMNKMKRTLASELSNEKDID